MIKKYVVKLLLGAVALAVALSFFACNDSENETDNIDNIDNVKTLTLRKESN